MSRIRSARALAFAALSAAALTGCAKEISTGFPVEVTVLGSRSEGAVTLRWDSVHQESLKLAATGGAAQMTVISEAVLPAQTSFTLLAPEDCRFDNGTNEWASQTEETPTELTLACPGVLELSTLGADQAVDQSFQDQIYQLTLGVLRIDPSPELTISPKTAQAGATITINNNSSPTQSLGLGTHTIAVAFPAFGLSRSYSLRLSSASKENEKSQERVQSPDADRRLGSALAADGDLVAVGLPGESSVWVMRRSDTGWTREAILTGDGATAEFGAALAISGDTIAVGAPRNGTNVTGSVHVFVRTGTNWAQVRRLDSLVRDGRFGTSVALTAGGSLAVGAPNETSAQGAVYVYPRLGETVGQEQRLIPALNRTNGDAFGAAVAFAGDKLWIGAPFEDSSATQPEGATDSGAVYRFAFSNGSNTWSQEAVLKSSPMPLVDGRFGALLAGSGDWLAASWKNGSNGSVDCLSAISGFRYTISAGGLVAALALDHGRVAVSVPGAGGVRQVAAYRLNEVGSVAMATPFAGPEGSSGFGAALTFAGDRLLIGAPTSGAAQHGAFYTYE